MLTEFAFSDVVCCLRRTVQASETERRTQGEVRLLKELSHRLWPEVVAALEKKKQERKDKREGKTNLPSLRLRYLVSFRFFSFLLGSIFGYLNVLLCFAAAKPSRSKKKSMGLRKRAAVPIDDVVVASEPAPKKKRVESPRLRDSPPSPLRSSSIASRTR
ncbi:unnamed protein product [Microthlaspi erraticum]|uniref:Uncharacterized protein n=1 Tax=Microthlaspi erraticum TaxID=1685480 RepID=A0A6D2HXQ6_9BRAS|nr:unnamed protein product [Microthlaspi erraticum]